MMKQDVAPTSAGFRSEGAIALSTGLELERDTRVLVVWTLQRLVKRLLDVFVAVVGLVLLSPVFLVVAVAVRVSSPGPVLFRQLREGFRGRPFTLLKFRSMRVERSPEHEIVLPPVPEPGILLKLREDPRVTGVGRILRATSLDELPQLWNVLRGDMSLVGPRPLIPFMLEPHPEFRSVRASFRPGITGLWQLRDRANNTRAQAMLLHDLEYIERFSLVLDLRILLLTIPAVLSGKGAF